MVKRVSSAPKHYPAPQYKMEPTQYTDALKVLLECNGKNSSDLSELEKRVVDLFTRRVIDLNGNSIRRMHSYCLASTEFFASLGYDTYGAPTTVGHAMYKNFIVYEDEEINYPIVVSPSKFVIDDAIMSLKADKYIPVRSKKNDEFCRICKRIVKKAGVDTPTEYQFYQVFSSGFLGSISKEGVPTDAEFSKSDKITPPNKLSLCGETIRSTIYSTAEFNGDSFFLNNTSIEIDEPLLPTQHAVCKAITVETVGMLLMYSLTNIPAPTWVVDALTYYKNHGDEALDNMLPMPLGLFNRDGKPKMHNLTHSSKSRTLNIAFAGRANAYPKK